MLMIRNAEPKDSTSIIEIYNLSISGRLATADTEPVTLTDREQWFRAHQNPLRPLWVAERNGLVMGWLSFQSFYGRPAYSATAEVSVYVSPHAHRCGVGTALLKRAIQMAPELQIKTLLGFIFEHNIPSVKLFEKHGFLSWGNLPRIANLDGIERSLLILGRRTD